MQIFWMMCPCDSHTCVLRSCLANGCGGIAERSVTTSKVVDDEPTQKPDKDDPRTWEVKVR